MSKSRKTVILKLGSKLLTTDRGKLDLNNLRQLVNQAATAIERYNIDLIIVSSGAIVSGAERLNIIPDSIPEKQAAASVGQRLLLQEYGTFFEHFGLQIGQVLLTRDGLVDPDRCRHTIDTITTLLSHRVVPIINENDTVAIDEICFGDNDELSGIVAGLMNADLLVILSDIDGLHDGNPKMDDGAPIIHELDRITDDTFRMVEDDASLNSHGGMSSKLRASQYASENGTEVVLANGRIDNVLFDILDGDAVGTRIRAQQL